MARDLHTLHHVMEVAWHSWTSASATETASVWHAYMLAATMEEGAAMEDEEQKTVRLVADQTLSSVLELVQCTAEAAKIMGCASVLDDAARLLTRSLEHNCDIYDSLERLTEARHLLSFDRNNNNQNGNMEEFLASTQLAGAQPGQIRSAQTESQDTAKVLIKRLSKAARDLREPPPENGTPADSSRESETLDASAGDGPEVASEVAGAGPAVCPITQREIDDAVRNMGCGHVYERRGLAAYVKSKRRMNQWDRHLKISCPVNGCTSDIDPKIV